MPDGFTGVTACERNLFDIQGERIDARGPPPHLTRPLIAAAPEGSATRTLPGKAEVVPIRYGDLTPRYRVECWRSIASYMHDFLKEAAFELGPVGQNTLR